MAIKHRADGFNTYILYLTANVLFYSLVCDKSKNNQQERVPKLPFPHFRPNLKPPFWSSRRFSQHIRSWFLRYTHTNLSHFTTCHWTTLTSIWTEAVPLNHCLEDRSICPLFQSSSSWLPFHQAWLQPHYSCSPCAIVKKYWEIFPHYFYWTRHYPRAFQCLGCVFSK